MVALPSTLTSYSKLIQSNPSLNRSVCLVLRWITLSKSLDTLRAQLDRAKQDVETLQALKQAALEDPEHFLGLLQKNVLLTQRFVIILDSK